MKRSEISTPRSGSWILASSCIQGWYELQLELFASMKFLYLQIDHVKSSRLKNMNTSKVPTEMPFCDFRICLHFLNGDDGQVYFLKTLKKTVTQSVHYAIRWSWTMLWRTGYQSVVFVDDIIDGWSNLNFLDCKKKTKKKQKTLHVGSMWK